MRHLVIALAAAGCAAQQTAPEPPAPPATIAAADRAGNRLEALIEDGGRFCTADGGWCADASAITYLADGSTRTLEINDPEQERGVWPFVVFVGPQGDHALFGITTLQREGYSGGGASTESLTLYEVVSHGAAIEPVLAVPLSGSAMIRACFSEADMRARLEACHDEYAYLAALSLDTSTQSGHPRFSYAVEAATYPGPLDRMEDSSQKGPLRRSDLVWAQNQECSFRRTLVLDEQAAHYMPTEPMPECSDFLIE